MMYVRFFHFRIGKNLQNTCSKCRFLATRLEFSFSSRWRVRFRNLPLNKHSGCFFCGPFYAGRFREILVSMMPS